MTSPTQWDESDWAALGCGLVVVAFVGLVLLAGAGLVTAIWRWALS